jgi:hypothetical protein
MVDKRRELQEENSQQNAREHACGTDDSGQGLSVTLVHYCAWIVIVPNCGTPSIVTDNLLSSDSSVWRKKVAV